MEQKARHLSARGWLGYLAGGLAVVAAYYAVPLDGGGGSVARVVLYCAVTFSSAVAVAYGVYAYRPSPARPWVLLGLSQAVYACADTAFYVSHYLFGSTAYPSLADVLYLAHYPLIVAGFTVLIRHRTPGRDTPGLLDASTIAVSAALLSWLFLIAPQARDVSPMLPKLVSVAYPVMDLALLVVALRMVLGAGRRPAAFYFLIGNLAAILAADTFYVFQQLGGDYTAGNALDLIWLVGNLSLGVAALHPTMRQVNERATAVSRGNGRGRIVMLSAAAFVAPCVLLANAHHETPDDIIATAVACALLFTLTITRLGGLILEQRRLAVTDALTGLHTRRYLEERLTAEIARRDARIAVYIVDVDHFKAVNDCYGHPAGDRALVEIAARLRDAVSPGDVLARYGGEEFAVLRTDAQPDELLPIAERLRCAVAARPIVLGPDVTIVSTVSVGAVIGVGGAQTPDDLVAAADRALYRAKVRGRDRAAVGEPDQPQPAPAERMPFCHQTPMIDFLRRIADEVDRWLAAEEHSTAISRWATLLAEHLGHDEATRWRLELAGRLHDIGKIVVPQAILTKPGVLTEDEWLLVRRHPDHGARLAQLVPGFETVAESIRQHHERFDGSGYPDGRIGNEIRLEARIIAVCDSWAAMRSNRSYQSALTDEQARDQLARGRGTQFDPAVADLFLDLHAAGAIGDLTRMGPAVAPSAPLHAGLDTALDSALSARVFQKLIS